MNRNQALTFQSLQGFRELIIQKSAMFSRLQEIFEWAEAFGFPSNIRPEYNKIRLLDTFFSDSFPQDLLDMIAQKVVANSYTTQILFLNPTSELAVTRGRALGEDPVEQVNLALFNIRKALNNHLAQKASNNRELSRFRKSHEFIEEQLDHIKTFQKDARLTVRFYDCMTDVPVYIISQFVAKGQILYDRSAADNPWMIFVDDPAQKFDVYDRLSDNFDQIWKTASTRPHLSKTNNANPEHIFVSHGGERLVAQVVMDHLHKHGLKPIFYDGDKQKGVPVLDNVENAIGKCSIGIAVLTKEDVQEGGAVRARQNVVHEIGYCQARYGRENVLLLLQQGVERPTNLDGIDCILFEEQKPDVDKLLRELDAYLSKKNRIPSSGSANG